MGKGKKVTIARKDEVKIEKAEASEAGSMNRFQSYLHSEEGMGTMKMFVVMNSLVMILTLGWPAMKTAYDIIVEKLEEYDLMKYLN